MSPPKGPAKLGPGAPSATSSVSPAEERRVLLSPENFMVDPSNSADPQHLAKKWKEDRDYRLGHQQISDVIDYVGRFIKRDSTISSQNLAAYLKKWTQDPKFKEDPLNVVVLGNIRRILGQFETPDNGEQAKKLQAMLPPEEKPPEAAKPAETKPAAKPPVEGNPPPEGWRFIAVTGQFHFLDDKFRILPSIYTLGVIPKEGFGQNQSSDFGLKLGTEFSYRDFGFFTEFYYNDAKPLSALNSASPTLDDPKYNAKFGQAGVNLGMVEYGGSLYGGTPGEGWHGGLFGRKRVGIGLGAGWCQEVAAPELGAKCSNSNFQLSVFNDGDFLSGGYGPVEVGFRLLPITTYLNFPQNGLPESNRLPIEFFLSYHVNSPYVADKATTADDVLAANERVTDAQVTMSALNLFTGTLRNNNIRKTETAYQSQRIIALAIDDKQYGLLNAGTMVGGVVSGFNEGTTAYRLQRELRFGSNGHRIGLGVLLGTEMAINLAGMFATPGLPTQSEYLAGEREGITNLQARTFRLSLPTIATRDALLTLGAVGAFGDLNKSIKGEPFHSWWWPSTHAFLGLGGLVMVLTSGDQSGSGFFGRSILGNTPPNTDRLEIVGSPYDYPGQSGQFYRLETGAMALSYGVSGLLEWGLDKYKYNDLKANPKPESSGKKQDKKGPDIHIGVNTDGRTAGNVTVFGSF